MANENIGSGALTALGTLLGPMTGAIARQFQDCCLEFSVQLMMYSFPFLLIAAFSQIHLGLGKEFKGMKNMRTVWWTVGWVGWFLAGVVSFGHALS